MPDERTVEDSDQSGAKYPNAQVREVVIDDRRFLLVGTAHISKKSVELVKQVIDQESPDRVCIELDEQRYEALTQRDRWESLDLKQVIRKKQLPTLFVNLLLSVYQRRLGEKLGVIPGTELLTAAEAAEERGIPFSLCDRDVRITMRRAWRTAPFFKRIWLLSAVLGSAVTGAEVGESEIEELLQTDILTQLIDELGAAMPSLKAVLIDERDLYLAAKIMESSGEKVVAVVGAGHLRGIEKALSERAEPDLDRMTFVPPASGWGKVLGWGIPALIVGSILYIGLTRGLAEAGDNMAYWIVANGTLAGLGALVALAHPLTILASVLTAPFTSLTPAIGVGYVAAFVQTYVRPPRVFEFHSLFEQVSRFTAWWRNRLLKIFLTFILATIGSLIGSGLGGFEIISNLFD